MSTLDPAQPMTTSAPRGFGPSNPETFFRAQKRNRRATWRMSALCVFAAFLMGIPLTLVLTPLLYALTLVGADIVNYFSPLPPEFWQTANSFAQTGIRMGDYFFDHKGRLDPQELAVTLALVLLPGMLLAFFLWVGMQLLFRHGGVGGALASLGAREPNQADLKELQLADVVQEMAIAAGLPAPKLMLLDSPGANAAAIGTSPHDARIVISRRLIDDLDRDQLQALLASLVASIGNGDLGIAFTVTSVFETCGLIITLINSPFGKQSRSALWRIARYTFSRSAGDTRAEEAAEVANILSETLDGDSTDIDRFFNQPNPGLIRKFFRFVFFPVQFTNIAVEITLWFFLNVLLGPAMALLWRTRRYLADAGAVELTRNPDALAGAFEKLSQDSTAVEGGSWASHLFVVNPTGDKTLRGSEPSTEQIRQAAKAWAASGSTGTAPRAGAADYARLRQELVAAGLAAARGDSAAAARMQAFMDTMAKEHGSDQASVHMPNFADIAAAQRGDRPAMARLRAMHTEQQAQPRHGQSGLQTHSFLSFHPPLSKRARRLARMGSHLLAPERRSGPMRVVGLAVAWLILGPLMLAAGAMMLVAISLMIGLNLLFLTLWLLAIHWAFAQPWDQHIRAFLKFVNQVSDAFDKGRR